MLNRTPIEQLDDFFKDLSSRKQRGVYFYRIDGYNSEIHEFLLQYHEAARRCGVIIEGKLPNPDQKMLDYFGEMMHMDFELDRSFLNAKLQKWLPRMNAAQRENVSGAMFAVLTNLKKAGKNDNILKNVYIKFMCWLYYRMERILHQLGNESLPKILYEGDISNYELLLFSVLSLAGCDIVLLEYQGDAGYLRADPESARSAKLSLPDMKAFPKDFSLKALRQEMQERAQMERLYLPKPECRPCTNAWLTGKLFEDLRKAPAQRGADVHFYYNCFCRMNGTEDKLIYQNELYNLRIDLDAAKRRIVIVNLEIPQPTPDEVSSIPRKTYQKPDQLILDLTGYFKTIAQPSLQKMMHNAFVELMLEESRKESANINRLLNKAVYLLCWIKRYTGKLFAGWKFPEISVFIFLGGCQNEHEALFCRYLAKLPVDVLILKPDLSRNCCLKDSALYERNFTESLAVDRFPDEQQGLRVGTAAYHAERDLDAMMYQDSGLYRNQQYDRANSITLQTMYEEIAILWAQEMKYRPSFSVNNDCVNIPVIFSKVVGVKDGDVTAYWQGIKALITPDTILIPQVPRTAPGMPNPFRQFAPEFLKNGHLQKRLIKAHKAYPYRILREPMQDHILDKMQLLIDRKLIKGTFENGTEYTIIADILNLDVQTVRLIQKFDFTKQNPKVIVIVTHEAVLSLDDAIYLAFLNLVGFDVVLFVPTGYQCVEQHLNQECFEVHQIGEYKYDLRVPNFSTISDGKHGGLFGRIFKRGN